MSTSWRVKSGALLCSMLFLTGTSTAVGAALGATPLRSVQSRSLQPDSEQAPDDDVAAAVAAIQLGEDYGITIEEATSRIARQQALIEIASDVATKTPETNAGGYIDHSEGGRLVLRTTDPSQTAAAVKEDPGRIDPSLIAVVDATWSRADLEHAIADFRAQGPDEGDTTFLVDVRSNKVVVRAGATADKQAAARDIVEHVNAEHDAPILTLGEPGDVATTSCQTSYRICDAPLRGGLVIGGAGNGGYFGCTSGFNVVSKSDAKRFVLTAGHCLSPANCGGVAVINFETYQYDMLPHQIGPRHAWHYGCSSVTDAGIVSITNVPGWNPYPWVYVAASGPSAGGYSTVSDFAYGISGVGTLGTLPGGYLCKTGASTATKCGEYLNDGQTSGGVTELGYINTKNCEFDSGGPMYIGHKGYGITHGAFLSDRVADQYVDAGLVSNTVRCYSRTLYVGLTRALAATNTELLGT